MQPAYYLGRRVTVFHAASHPVSYVYTWAGQAGPPGGTARLRVAHTAAYGRPHRRRRAARPAM